MLLLFAKKKLSRAIASLFATGKEGVVLDQYDNATMFQDAAGTTPVTALGQTVQLMLDKSKGLALGSELLGSFVTAVSGAATAATYNTTTGAGVCYRIDVGNKSFVRVTGLTANRLYLVNVTNTGSNAFSVRQNTDAVVIANVSAGQTVSMYVSTATHTDIAVVPNQNGQTHTFTINSVREIAGNHVRFYNTTLQARNNLLTKSEQFDDAAWAGFAASITPNTTVAPGGATTADTMQESGSAAIFRSSAALTTISGQTYTVSFHAKRDNFDWKRILVSDTSSFTNYARAWFNIASGSVGAIGNGGSGFTAVSRRITAAANGFYRCELTFTTTATALYVAITSASADSSTSRADAGSGAGVGTKCYLWGAQIDLGPVATTYQRVNTATDYQDIGAPRRLSFNGSSSYGVTLAPIVPGSDKVTVIAGVRKNSDANIGIVCELGPNSVTTDGTLMLTAPAGAGSASYGFRSRGTTERTANPTGYASPITNVVTGVGDIAGDTCVVRVNGVVAGTNTADQGSGNYGTYNLFIGARNGASLFFNGDLFGLNLVFDQVATGRIGAIERQYGRERVGVTW